MNNKQIQSYVVQYNDKLILNLDNVKHEKTLNTNLKVTQYNPIRL